MKKFILPTLVLVTVSAVVQATPPGAETKNYSSEASSEKKFQPNSAVVININQLREKTKDVSLLKPVCMIVSTVESITEKLHGRKLKITCNKSADQRD